MDPTTEIADADQVNDDAEPAEDGAEPAGVRPRALAYFVDLVLVGGAALAVANRRSESLPARALWFGLLATVGGLLYHVALEGSTGRTAGKATVGIAVVDANGDDPTYRAAAVRTAARFVDWLPAGYAVGIASIALTERRQRVGDLAADTRVVETRDPDGRRRR